VCARMCVCARVCVRVCARACARYLCERILQRLLLAQQLRLLRAPLLMLRARAMGSCVTTSEQ
jgi:hypothetical protein